MAVPRGWLEGDPCIHAVHFGGPDDPRVALYAVEFEDGAGRSVEPDAYQMYRLDYASWLEERGADGGGWMDEDGVPWRSKVLRARPPIRHTPRHGQR